MEANGTKFKANEAYKAVHEWINGVPIMLVLILFALLQKGAAIYASGSEIETRVSSTQANLECSFFCAE